LEEEEEEEEKEEEKERGRLLYPMVRNRVHPYGIHRSGGDSLIKIWLRSLPELQAAGPLFSFLRLSEQCGRGAMWERS